MANKDLRLQPHRITYKKSIVDNVWIYEEPAGLWVYLGNGRSVTLTWSRIRAALKRKDKK